MKFISNILTLIAVSSACAITIPYQNLFRRADGAAGESFDVSALAAFKDCDEAIKKECDLPTDITKNNLEATCTTYKTDACQKLLTDGVSAVAACSSLTGDLLALKDEVLKLQKVSVGFLCTKDEKGKTCPFVEFELGLSSLFNYDLTAINDANAAGASANDEEDKEEEAALAAINETCKSKICTNSLVENYSMLKNYENELSSKLSFNVKKREFKMGGDGLTEEQKLQKVLDYLKSEECTAQAVESSQTSNAATMRFKSAIIVALSLILYVIL